MSKKHQNKPRPLPSRRLHFLTLESDSQLQTGVGSYEDLGKCVCPGAADVALGGVERHVVDGLLKLLAVGGELLDACLALHVPQTDRAVVACEEEERKSVRTEEERFLSIRLTVNMLISDLQSTFPST